MTYYHVVPKSLGWYLVIGAFLLILLSILSIGKLVNDTYKDRIVRCIGFYLLFDLLFLQGYMIYQGSYCIKSCIPLTFCSIMQLCAAIAAITKKVFYFEIGILFGITGPIQAFVSPAVVCQGQEYILIDYFISHGLTIIVPLYLLICNKFTIRKGAFFRACIFLQLVVFGVYLIDIALGANYMYLVERPPVSHPLNYGIWPYYLFVWHGIFYAIAWVIASLFWFGRYIESKTIKDIL